MSNASLWVFQLHPIGAMSARTVMIGEWDGQYATPNCDSVIVKHPVMVEVRPKMHKLAGPGQEMVFSPDVVQDPHFPVNEPARLFLTGVIQMRKIGIEEEDLQKNYREVVTALTSKVVKPS